MRSEPIYLLNMIKSRHGKSMALKANNQKTIACLASLELEVALQAKMVTRGEVPKRGQCGRKQKVVYKS